VYVASFRYILVYSIFETFYDLDLTCMTHSTFPTVSSHYAHLFKLARMDERDASYKLGKNTNSNSAAKIWNFFRMPA